MPAAPPAEGRRSSFVISEDDYDEMRKRARKLGMTVPGLAGLILRSFLAEDFRIDFKATPNGK